MADGGKRLDSNLVWIDLEMTGLNPDRDVILEAAILVTTANLEILDEGLDLVIWQPEESLKLMSEKVKLIHEGSGLIQAVKNSKLKLEVAETLALDYIDKFCVPEVSPLCGNTIFTDRQFIAKHLPKLNSYLFYRNIDVSTIKELYKRWGPNDPMFKKTENHRAMDDIKESVEEMRFYQKNFFCY